MAVNPWEIDGLDVIERFRGVAERYRNALETARRPGHQFVFVVFSEAKAQVMVEDGTKEPSRASVPFIEEAIRRLEETKRQLEELP